MMRRLYWAFCLLGFCLLFSAPLVSAIGEITPTPSSPQTPGPYNELETLNDAYLALAEGDNLQVIRLADLILENNPNNAEAYAVRGIAYSNEARYLLAIDDFTRALVIVPYSWEFYTFRGNAYAQSGEAGEAVLDFNQAIAINPRYDLAYIYRSYVAFSQGDDTKASVDNLIAEGISAFNYGDTDTSIERFTQAVDLVNEPTTVVAYALYNRCLAYFQIEKWDEALADCNQSIEILPELHDSYLLRGTVFRFQDNLAYAGRDYTRRIELLESDTITQAIAFGDITIVPMDYGTVYRLTIEAQAGDRLTLNAWDEKGVGVDPLMAIVGPDGNPLAGDDDSGGNYDAQIANFPIPESGTYTLLISHANGGYVGDVSVQVRR